MKNFNCSICPRKCNINRSSKSGFCGQNEKIFVSKVMLHKFEEPCISGNADCVLNNKGSGAIFFCGCNLKCIYCQNHTISQEKSGKEISINTLADLFKQLENAGAHNINLVTPTHYTEQIIEALKIYKPLIPVVWNSSGYELPETIEKLKNYVDIFLIDFKYHENSTALELSNAPNYPEFAKQVLFTAKKLQPNDIFDENGILQKGLIVRNLVLPEFTNESICILDWIKQNLGANTIVSIMSQYVPMHKAIDHCKIGRRLKPIEYKFVVNHAKKIGLNNAYLQDPSSSDTSFTPDFSVNDKIFNF